MGAQSGIALTLTLGSVLGCGCAPGSGAGQISTTPVPSPSLSGESAVDTGGRVSDLEAHRTQVQNDTEAFLAHRQQQAAAVEPTIEWTMPGRDTSVGSSTTPPPTTEPPAPTTTMTGPVDEPVTVAASSTVVTVEDADASGQLQQAMIDFSRELYVSSTWSDRPLKELMVLASLAMLDPERAIDPQAIPDLTMEERSLLATMQKYFIAIGTDMDSETNPMLALSTATTELQRRLKQTPDLELPTLALCTRVGGFGDFDEWSPKTDQKHYSFVAHTSQPVIIYLEMEGFTSNLNDNDLWETVTSQHLTIYSDRDGIPVWKEDWQSASDRSRKRRRDYFTVQKFQLPRGLSVGRYQLKVRVRDEKTGAETEQNIPFTMTAGVLN
ncbi:MAG: hypothetical protein CMJ24_11560 [Phycisphaerae bacterium]|nr:hypothetical protein [Phycisphaerae bacterium]MDG1898773.1 hypothetical protein [Phycisphaerales bacterium]|tara:strand:+ start:20122 stop:21267 length:1146 start_codon:yes stop_codon:yes gene_type:complete